MTIGPAETVALLAVFGVIFLIMMRGPRTATAGENLASIFEEPSRPLPGQKARVWALATLYDAGVDADSDPVYAMKVLRQAEPRLSLVAAKALVDTINRY